MVPSDTISVTFEIDLLFFNQNSQGVIMQISLSEVTVQVRLKEP